MGYRGHDWDQAAVHCPPRLSQIRCFNIPTPCLVTFLVDRLWKFLVAVSKQPYEKRNWELAGSTLGFNSSLDLSSIFCSELVTLRYLSGKPLREGVGAGRGSTSESRSAQMFTEPF